MAPRANLFLLKGKFTYKRVVLEQNQSFDELPIGGVPIVCHFADPLVTNKTENYSVSMPSPRCFRAN